ncbi:MAG: acetyl ornithine aminotransferase family protein [Planctomycetes bacterium]|nr:acetyl ornithine aminotransferase family protein [Planctomycetota bacterium]
MPKKITTAIKPKSATPISAARYPKVPDLKMPLPGPKARAVVALDDKFVSPSYTRSYPMVIERGLGLAAEDVDGNVFLDMTAGIAVNATGFAHPDVVAAIQDAAAQFAHMSGTDFYYAAEAELARVLAEHTYGGVERRVFFSNSGTESIECAIKLARWYTKRPYILSFRGAFHGRTYGSMSVGCSKAIHRNHFAPLVSSVVHGNYPYLYRADPHLKTEEAVVNDCLSYLENVVFAKEVQPEEVAAILVEPVQGEGGYVVPHASWLPGLRKLCDKHGILLVFDEVQSGMGRTGKFFAHEHFNTVGDIICTAKGIASGLPLGAVIAKKEIMSWPPGSHASTFGGNPIACRAALATIKLLDESLIENTREVGAYFKQRLEEFAKTSDVIGDVRGLGLMLAAEFVKSKSSKERNPELRNRVEETAFHRGLLLIGCGANTIRFCPPLVITKSEVDTAMDLFKLALKDAQA